MKKYIKITLWSLLGGLFIFILLSIFWLADLRTTNIKNNTQGEDQIELAKSLLSQAIIKQGLDKVNHFSTYEIIGTDHWKGMMGKMGNPWNWNNDKMAMRFSIGDFDGQVEVLEGDKKGFVAGIQSWDYYEIKEGNYNSNVNDDEGKIFTLAAFHYFAELANRLSNAPFIRYAGQDQFKGKQMDKIFVSWGNDCTKEYDHYLLWISKESGLIEAVTFTTRNNFMPAPVFMFGSLRFDEFNNINGILIPFKQTAQLMNPKDDIDDYIHQLNIEKFEWDNFAISEIRPFSDLVPIGDDKSVN